MKWIGFSLSVAEVCVCVCVCARACAHACVHVMFRSIWTETQTSLCVHFPLFMLSVDLYLCLVCTSINKRNNCFPRIQGSWILHVCVCVWEGERRWRVTVYTYVCLCLREGGTWERLCVCVCVSGGGGWRKQSLCVRGENARERATSILCSPRTYTHSHAWSAHCLQLTNSWFQTYYYAVASPTWQQYREGRDVTL